MVITDNGTNFEKAHKEMERWWKVLKSDKVRDYAAIKQMRWHFNPPAAPWWGGFFERMLRSIKEPLRKVFSKALMTEEELSTALCEVEALVNSRPLTYISDDEIILTPAHLMIGKDLQAGVISKPSAVEVEAIKRWRYRTHIVESLPISTHAT